MFHSIRILRRFALVAGGTALLAAGGALATAAHPVSAVHTVPAASTAGASTPFASYEAEAGSLGGGASVVSLASAPTTQYASATLEASGHAYVQLTGTGQSVQWTNNTGQPISFVNVRTSIPDASGGGGATATLDLYVNGAFRQALNLNSRQSWLYEGNNNYNGNDQNPADGDPRVFFDEFHTFVSGAPIAAGSTFSLVRDSSNTANFYDVDVVDVENPPAAIAQPAGSISITSCGAVADNNPTNGDGDSGAVDSTAAIQNCINQAQSQGKVLWIPQGTFYLKGTTGLQATGITIAGAGMWYSNIYREVPLPNSTPLAAVFSVTSCTVGNFHVDSNATSRATVDGAGGAMDTSGTNWVANGIWSQHTESGFWASGSGGTVENSRLTSIWADGINLNNVSLNGTTGNNLTATNNFVRGTGDDAMAINSVAYNTNNGVNTYYTAMSNVTLTNNTLIAPWGGKGIGIYGGGGHHVQNNYISDTARYIGLGAGRFGVNGSDLTSATVSGNVVVRAGGNAYSQGQPAMQIGNGGDGQNTGIVDSVSATGNTVINSLYDSIGFSTSTNTTLQNNTITSPWRNGIVIAPPFYPAPSGSATITGNTVTGLSSGMSAFINNSGGFAATVSNNSWQGTTTGPVLGANPASLSFAGTVVGSTAAAQTVTVTNSGTTSATVSGVAVTGDFSQTNNCSSVAVNASCTVNVSFKPTASGTRTGTLTVTSNANNNPTTVALTGTGVDNSTNVAAGKTATASSTNSSFVPANLTDTDASTYWESTNGVFPQWAQVDLGQSYSVGKLVLKLPPSTAWGARTETLSVLGSTDGSTFSTIVGSAGYTFDPNANGNTVTITFNATTARYVRVNITANTGWPAGQFSDFEVFLSGGSNTPSATLSANPTSLTFANQALNTSSAAQSVTVSNTGSAAASVSGVTVSGDYAQTNTCGSSIAAGGSCTVSVTFTPTAAGARNGTLTVTSSASNSPTSVALAGTGIIPTITNLAAGKATGESSHTDVYASSNVTDSNQNTYWESANNALPQWVQVDLGSAQSASRVVLQLPAAWGARNQTLSVLGSTDGSNFSTIVGSATYAFSPTTNNTVTITFASTTQRYVRVNITANTGWPAGQVSEVQIYQ